MTNIYRVYPILWEGQGCMDGQTVYAIDRLSPVIPTICSKRPRADPAFTWDSPTFQRLRLPTSGICNSDAVTWSSLPSWISYVSTIGYSLLDNSALTQLKPYSDLYITGP